MRRFWFLIILFIFITSCSESQPRKVTIKTFVVVDFCKRDIVNYFSKPDILAVGINFKLLEHNRKLLGSEHVIGTAIVESEELDAQDLNSFINGSLSECYPNARVDFDLNEEPASALFNRRKVPGESVGSNRLIRLHGDKLMVYSKYQ